MSLLALFRQGDAVTQGVGLVLLAMSVASWVVILWKSWLLARASRDVARSTTAFWQCGSLAEAQQQLPAYDRESLVQPLVRAAAAPPAGGLAALAARPQQLTRLLREALHGVLDKLRFGQVLLASVGATAPFVGLLGTVWSIYHALSGIAHAGQISLAQVAGPVGEALIMTAAGLAVAIPAVLAYNVFGRRVARIEADLEGFARDLRELMADAARTGGSSLAGQHPQRPAAAAAADARAGEGRAAAEA